MIRAYLKLHLWLNAKCARLSLRERRIFFYGLSALYFVSSLSMIAFFFIPEETEIKEEKNNNPIELIDAPKHLDSIKQQDSIQPFLT